MAEIYGTAWTETAKDKIKVLLDALLTTMASGYDPTFLNTYDRHNVADIDLNAITIDTVEFETEPVGVTTGVLVRHVIRLSIRVHTAYAGGRSMPDDNLKLLTSIANKLHDNENLSDNYRIVGIVDTDVNAEFVESGTLGGELIVEISYITTHIQE